MKTYKISFLVYHESYNGYDHCDGWSSEYVVEARNSDSATKKAEKLWRKAYHNAYWYRNVLIKTEV
jgi:hypothetical protein